ncbi:hypothetical protein ACFWN1_33320 [Streptomyces sp. NPDC058459]|uniref:hypothetical protein n=1 Tax=Streptomyces sp. NPDC058459 TaxID=3346508 RepID=UPI00365774E4
MDERTASDMCFRAAGATGEEHPRGTSKIRITLCHGARQGTPKAVINQEVDVLG